MEANQIFNQSNVIFWIIFAVIILVQGMTVGKPIISKWKRWPEPVRFWIGWITFFGATLFMVIRAGWDPMTWLWLSYFVFCSRLLVQWSPLAKFWKRKDRENHRWVVIWFTPFLVLLPVAPDFRTLLLMFCTLGVAGLVKVGWEGTRDSWRARELRRRHIDDGTSIG